MDKIFQYVRINNQLVGVLVAKRFEDEIIIDYSLCRPSDRFDKKLGMKIAEGRCDKFIKTGICTDRVLPRFALKPMQDFLNRSCKYFKVNNTRVLTSWVWSNNWANSAITGGYIPARIPALLVCDQPTAKMVKFDAVNWFDQLPSDQIKNVCKKILNGDTDDIADDIVEFVANTDQNVRAIIDEIADETGYSLLVDQNMLASWLGPLRPGE